MYTENVVTHRPVSGRPESAGNKTKPYRDHKPNISGLRDRPVMRHIPSIPYRYRFVVKLFGATRRDDPHSRSLIPMTRGKRSNTENRSTP